MAPPRLRFASRQGDVDAGDLEHLEAFAHGLDSPDALEDGTEPVGREAEHFEVDVLRLVTEQAVAHPSADDERASTGVAHERGQMAGTIDGRQDLEVLRHHTPGSGGSRGS